jgi:DNA-binding beta-propeller fold protein YncE
VNSGTSISGSGTGAIVTLATAGRTDYPTANNPQDIVFEGSTPAVWITNNSGSDTLSKMDVSSGANTVYFVPASGGGSYGIAYNNDLLSPALWQTAISQNTVTSIDLLGNPGSPITVDSGPYDVAFDTPDNAVWVTNNLGNTISKVDSFNMAPPQSFHVGSSPTSITFDNITSSVWVVAGSELERYNTGGSLINTYLVSTNPADVVLDNVTNSVWVTNNGNTVSKIDINDINPIVDYPVGSGASGLAFDSVTNSIWVANTSDNTISKVDIFGVNPTVVYPVGNSPQNIAFDSSTNSVWVTNSGSNTVSKIDIFSLPSGYTASGAFTSAVIDLGAAATYTTLAYTDTIPANTTLTLDVRAGNTSTPDGSWTGWTTGVASGGDISALNDNRYVQYQANFATTDTAVTASLDDVTINYSQYQSSGALVSSVFDSGSAANFISRVDWTTTDTSPTEIVKLQVRSSADNVTWSNWCGPSVTCDGSSYFLAADNGIGLASNHPLKIGNDDRYFQYKVTLLSSGNARPSVTSVGVGYDVASGAPPIISNVATSTLTDTGVVVTWDTDIASGSYINYSTSPTLSGPINVGNGTLTTSHLIALAGLASNQTYYFDVVSGVSTDDNAGSHYAFTTLAAVTPPPSGGGGGGLPGAPIITNVSSGNATCTIPFSWEIKNAGAPNLYNSTRAIQYSTAPSGSNVSFPVISGTNTIEARDGNTVLKTVVVECYYVLE